MFINPNTGATNPLPPRRSLELLNKNTLIAGRGLQPLSNVKSHYFRDLKRYGRGSRRELPRPAIFFYFKINYLSLT